MWPAIAISGVVDVIWTQVDTPDGFTDIGAFRWDQAMSGVSVIALGLIVCIGAQILRAVQGRGLHEWSRGTQV